MAGRSKILFYTCLALCQMLTDCRRCPKKVNEYCLPRSDAITTYIQTSPLPAPTELTVCLRTRDLERTEDGDIFFFSSQQPGAGAFDAALIWLSGPLFFCSQVTERVYYDAANLTAEATDLVLSSLSDSHTHCVVYNVTGEYVRYYNDLEVTGTLRLFSEVPQFSPGPLPATPIKPLAGELVDKNSGGKLSYFEVWERALSLEELQALTCTSGGDLVSLSDPTTFTSAGDPDVNRIPCW